MEAGSRQLRLSFTFGHEMIGYRRAVTTGPSTGWRSSARGVRTGSQNRNPVSGAPPHLWHRSSSSSIKPSSGSAPFALGYAGSVSPTVLRVKGFRFYFFSREERRAHVHVQHADGEAKFWIDPAVELAANFSLKPKQVTEAQRLIEEHLNEIRGAWAKHFPSGSPLTGSGCSWANASCLCPSTSSPGSGRRQFGKLRTSSFQVHTTCIGQTSTSIWRWNPSNTRRNTL